MRHLPCPKFDVIPVYGGCSFRIPAMHIPDGFLSNRVSLSMDVISGATILYAARRVRLDTSTRAIPLMGVLGAFVFAAQMLNFPVLGGTSGHLVGGALLAILLGPMAAFLTLSAVIIAQALFLQDGGVIALGANIFNIAAITSFTGYGIFRLLRGPATSGKWAAIAAFIAGWTSMLLSAACCAFQLAISGVIPWKVGLMAMVGYHAIIGIVEGGLTAAVLSFLLRVRPDLVKTPLNSRLGVADWVGAFVLVVIPAAILLLAGSSILPDPLERLLENVPAVAGASAGLHQLLAPERYREYLWQIGVFILVMAAVMGVNWVFHKRKGHV